MNWYSLHCASVNPIERIAAGLCAQIFEIIKTQVVNKKNKNNYADLSDMRLRVFPDTSLLNGLIPKDKYKDFLSHYTGMYLDIEFVDSTSKNFFLSGGLALNQQERYGLVFQVYIAPGFSYSDFRSFYADLQNTVRHELEHFIQHAVKSNIQESVSGMNSARNNKERWNGLKQYYLNGSELEAFVTSLYYQSKKTRRPFRQVLSLYLNHDAQNIIKHNNIHPEEVYSFMSDIYNRYLSYAQKRYPNINKTVPQPAVG